MKTKYHKHSRQNNLGEKRQLKPKPEKPPHHRKQDFPECDCHQRGNQRRANLSHQSLAK
jgi:hypothetical protein